MRTAQAIHVGKRVQQARKQTGLTQAQLAAELGLALRTLQSWEYGERSPRLEAFGRLALRLGKPIAWFYEGMSNGVRAA